METMTISQVSKTLDVSTRMIRYYEKMGLIDSYRKEEYAYRVYDEYGIRRLQQILVLRKLRIPLKQILVIFKDSKQTETLRLLQENITEIDKEIHALSTIRDILNVFLGHLNESIHNNITLDLLADSDLLQVVDTLSLSKFNL